MADTPDEGGMSWADIQEPFELRDLAADRERDGLETEIGRLRARLSVADAEIAKLRALHGEAANLLAEASAEIARLTAELDSHRNTPVELVPTAGIEAAMAADPGREDGSVLREMGGLKRAWAWKAATKTWEVLP